MTLAWVETSNKNWQIPSVRPLVSVVSEVLLWLSSYYLLLSVNLETFVEAATYVAHTSVSWQLLVFLHLSYIYTKNSVSIGQNKYIWYTCDVNLTVCSYSRYSKTLCHTIINFSKNFQQVFHTFFGLETWNPFQKLHIYIHALWNDIICSELCLCHIE